MKPKAIDQKPSKYLDDGVTTKFATAELEVKILPSCVRVRIKTGDGEYHEFRMDSMAGAMGAVFGFMGFSLDD